MANVTADMILNFIASRPDYPIEQGHTIMSEGAVAEWNWEKWRSGKVVLSGKIISANKGGEQILTAKFPFELPSNIFNVYLTPEDNGSIIDRFGVYGENGNVRNTKNDCKIGIQTTSAYKATLNIEVIYIPTNGGGYRIEMPLRISCERRCAA